MKKKNTLLTKIVAITFLFMLMLNNVPMSVAATSDTITASVTVNSILSIADDDTNLIVTMDPDTTDTSQVNTLTVESNDPNGFDVTVDLQDIQTSPVAGQLSDDSSGTNIFDGDGTTSYISVTSDAGTGSIPGSPTYQDSETKLGISAVNVLSSTSTTGSNTFDVHYDVHADNTIVPTTYEGTITFEITGKA